MTTDILYAVIVDGIPWVDAEGNDAFTKPEAHALADDLAFRRNFVNITVEETS